MSINDSLPVVLASLQNTPAVKEDVVMAAADVISKGGFSANATLGQMLEFQLTGLMVVFVVLGGLTVMCYLMGWILKMVAPEQYYGKKAPPATVPAAPPAPTTAPAATSAIHAGLSDDELVILLTVAASEALGQQASIIHFRPMGSMDWTWSQQGRIGLHNSHKLN